MQDSVGRMAGGFQERPGRGGDPEAGLYRRTFPLSWIRSIGFVGGKVEGTYSRGYGDSKMETHKGSNEPGFPEEAWGPGQADW